MKAKSARRLMGARIKLTGRVQRTGCRRYVLELAQNEGVTGYAQTGKDGSVTVFDDVVQRGELP